MSCTSHPKREREKERKKERERERERESESVCPTLPDCISQIWLKHCSLNTYQLAATTIFLGHPSIFLQIRKLCLANNGIDDIHFSLLLDGLDGTKNVEHLDLSDNRLKVTPPRPITAFQALGPCKRPGRGAPVSIP